MEVVYVHDLWTELNMINCLPVYKILDWSKLKAFAKDKKKIE